MNFISLNIEKPKLNKKVLIKLKENPDIKYYVCIPYIYKYEKTNELHLWFEEASGEQYTGWWDFQVEAWMYLEELDAVYVKNFKITKWSWDSDTHKDKKISNWGILSTAPIDYTEARNLVIEELRAHNYHFSGNYHQNGDYGCPIINNEYYFQVSQREWGDIMAEAYPNEDYSLYDINDKKNGFPIGSSRYLKWAWTDNYPTCKTPEEDYQNGTN